MQNALQLEKNDSSNYSAEAKYSDDSNALAVGKIKDEIRGIATEEFIGLRPKKYSILVSDSSGYEKGKGVNKNVVAKISHHEYNDVLNTKFLGYSMNRIQSKYHRIGSYKINKISFFCFNDKFYILDNGTDTLTLEFII